AHLLGGLLHDGLDVVPADRAVGKVDLGVVELVADVAADVDAPVGDGGAALEVLGHDVDTDAVDEDLAPVAVGGGAQRQIGQLDVGRDVGGAGEVAAVDEHRPVVVQGTELAGGEPGDDAFDVDAGGRLQEAFDGLLGGVGADRGEA